ncbi:hypothetical protein [Gorillibacterium sp. sgz500922]|uniref:hypothetical protein n=1 Tax=Gorillibacterium sp. sgz500922 TaxID=3446694 RepID=UPI003F67A120
MSYELRLTLLLIALILLLACSLFAARLPVFLRKGMALFSLLTAFMLLGRAYSEGGTWLQMKEHLRKNPAVAALIGQEPLIQGESRQGEWEGHPVTVQSFSVGTDWFAAVVNKTRSPYY